MLVRLRDAGFLGFDTVEGETTGIEQFPGIAPMLVLVVGSDGDVPASDVVMGAAARVGRSTARVGDVYDADVPDAGDRGSDLAELRDSDLSETVSTVDDLDRPIGPVTVALTQWPTCSGSPPWSGTTASARHRAAPRSGSRRDGPAVSAPW